MNLNLFSAGDRAKLDAARRRLRAPWTVAYCVWENEYAKSGGIGAVARDLPPALAAAGADVVVISPWHARLKTATAALALHAEVSVPFGSEQVLVRILEEGAGTVRRIFLAAAGFFTADGGAEGRDPYIYTLDPCATLDDCSLLRDSLFACAAIPRALAALGITANVTVHGQDWQFAATALTVKLAVLDGTLESASVAITSHNPYDHQLSPSMLALLTDRVAPELWQIDGEPIADSVYAHMLPLTDVPVSTVSRSFAAELTSDPLLSKHFTPHLQRIYRDKGVVGIPNGRFGHPPAVTQSKAEKRESMLKAITGFDDPRILGKLDTNMEDSIPVFFMFGRFDPGQKGFDVFARAIEAIPRGLARFILAPQARDPQAFSGDRLFINDLVRLAASRVGEVVIYPFHMGGFIYSSIMAGATFAVMPSFYEPFGAATEPYLAGTPVIARATGGLTDQVSDMVTGLLYRETVTLGGEISEQWAKIEKSQDPAERMSVPMYASMVAALAAALMRGAVLYSLCPERYARMLAKLPAKAAEFDWTAVAGQYLDWYAESSDRKVLRSGSARSSPVT